MNLKVALKTIYTVDEIFNSSTRADVKANLENRTSLKPEFIEAFKIFQNSEANILFLRRIKNTSTALKEIINKLEDKDIIYYGKYHEEDIFTIIKASLILIDELENCIRINDLIVINDSNYNTNIIKYIVNTISLDKYSNAIKKFMN